MTIPVHEDQVNLLPVAALADCSGAMSDVVGLVGNALDLRLPAPDSSRA